MEPRVRPAAPCRLCDAPLHHEILNLGMSPLCETVKPPAALDNAETFYPLRLYVCEKCWLVQLREYVPPDQIFSDYPYFSSYSDTWLDHARQYVDAMVRRWGLNGQSQVIEVASNDGYLLRNFVERKIPALGIEPAANVAEVARQAGVPTLNRFFGRALADELVAAGTTADLLVGNNVLAHVPNLNDFVDGLQRLLAPRGVLTMEFPHLVRMMQGRQFDTIYHEHFSYLSLMVVEDVLRRHGLRVFDVDTLATHGGSLRIFVQHQSGGEQPTSDRVHQLRQVEADAQLDQPTTYERFSHAVAQVKCEIVQFFLDAKRAGDRVAGYGAPGKGVTLLHYCGLDADLLNYTVDRSPHKQGHYIPGTSIPIHAPEFLAKDRPAYVFILPWNLRVEIMRQQWRIGDWGGRFVIPIPRLEIIPPAATRE